MPLDREVQVMPDSQDLLFFTNPDAVPPSPFQGMRVKANQLRRYYESNLDSYSEDNSTETKILIDPLGDDWSVQCALDFTQPTLGAWYLPGYTPSGIISTVRTASPSACTWIGLETESNLPKAVDWLAPSLERISELTKLRSNWDGYQARQLDLTTSLRAVNAALKIADVSSMTNALDSEPPFITLLASGGILFEIANRNRQLHLSFEPDKEKIVEVLKVSVTPAHDEVEEEFEMKDSKLVEVLSWIFEQA